MDIIESVLYGLFSGAAQFAPVSAEAHSSIIMSLFHSEKDPLRDLICHLACLVAVFICCRQLIGRIRYEMRIARRYRHTRSAKGTMRATYDLRLLRTAFLPLIIVLLLQPKGAVFADDHILVALFLILNGIILYVTDHIRQGNKTAPAMSQLDAIGIGASSVLSALPGVSRVGMNATFAVARGADKQNSLQWAFLLSIPALVLFCVYDVLSIISAPVNIASFWQIVNYLISAITAFAGGCAGISLTRVIVNDSGFSGFAYYSWGAALFSFILYMIV